MKKFLIALLVLTVLPMLSAGLFETPDFVSAQPKDAIIKGIDGAAGDTGGKSPRLRLQDTIESVVNIFSLVVGIIAVIMIIVGGLRYITSGGSAEKTTGAKNTILYALIGLVVVALSQVIVQFVLKNVL